MTDDNTHKLTTQTLQWLRDEKYHGETPPQYHTDVLRIRKGEPLDYVIGHMDFLHCTIDLSTKPLIPRTETEFWVQTAIKGILDKKQKPLRVLDMFAGSGCIGLAILRHVPYAHIDFAEIDAHHCKGIQRSALQSNIDTHRYSVIQSDVFTRIPYRYDYIFANPPYVPKGRTLDRSVSDWEPHRALFAPDSGLYYIKKLINEAPKHLLPHGVLYIEFDAPQKDYLTAYMQNHTHFQYTFHRDIYHRWRVLRAIYTTET